MLNVYQPKSSDGLPATGKKANYQEYVDPTGEFDSKQLKYGFWYVRHRELIHRISLWVAAAAVVIFLGISFWLWGWYLLDWNAANQTDRSVATGANYTGLASHFSPLPLQINGTQILPSDGDKYDAVASVTNPNGRFLARLDYTFAIGNVVTPVQSTVLLPGETRFVAALGLQTAGFPTAAVAKIENLTWSRISTHDVPQPADWQASHLDFSVSSSTFGNIVVGANGATAYRITFDFTNNTAYNYREANFYVALYQTGSLVGLMPLDLSPFKSLEIKHVDRRSFAPNLQVTDIKVFPLINIYNSDVYLPPASS